MVSVAVSHLGKTDLVFIQPRAKLNSDEVLAKGLLPVVRRFSGNDFTFQQDGAPSHQSKHTVAYLKANVPNFKGCRGLAGRSALVQAYLAAGESRRKCAYHDNYCDVQSWARAAAPFPRCLGRLSLPPSVGR